MRLALESIVIFIIAIIVLVVVLFIFGDQFKSFSSAFGNFMGSILKFTEINATGVIN